jgi:hypothetical protein
MSRVCFERAHLLLRDDADEHDAVGGGEARAVVRHPLVLALAPLDGTTSRRCVAENACTAATKRSWRGLKRAGSGTG